VQHSALVVVVAGNPVPGLVVAVGVGVAAVVGA
ncbi:hypothetical protein Tco_1364519, partial [Tanacetum coccineum]